MWVYDRENGTYNRQQPINTAVISHHYTVVDEKGQKDTKIESFLAKLEGNAKPVIDKLDAGELPEGQEDCVLALFISYLMMRVPSMEEAITRSTKETTKRVLNHLKCGDLERNVEVPRGFYFGTMIENAHEMAPRFRKMNWSFYRAVPEASFMTSDCPFLITPPKRKSTPSAGYGILTPKTKKIIPLSQKTIMVMEDFGECRAMNTIDSEDVCHFNMTTAANCNRWLYGSDQELLATIVKRNCSKN